jgi:hypothetical protein
MDVHLAGSCWGWGRARGGGGGGAVHVQRGVAIGEFCNLLRLFFILEDEKKTQHEESRHKFGKRQNL